MPPKKVDCSSDIADIHGIMSDMPRRSEIKDLIKSAVDEAVKSYCDGMKREIKNEILTELPIDTIENDIYQLQCENNELRQMLEEKEEKI